MLRTVLLLIAVLTVAGLPATPARAGSDDIAVVIGNRAYGSGIPEVAYALRDAQAMRRFVLEGLGIRPENLIYLENAGQAQLQATFGNERTDRGTVWRYLKPGRSHVFVFYSGHGVPGLHDRRGYLLPVDADPNAPEINGFPLDLLYRNLASLEAKSVTVFLDACFSGQSPGGSLVQAASGVVLTPKLPQAGGRLTVLSAAQADEVASWDEAARHGLFTRHLLDALYGAADTDVAGNRDGRLTMGEIKAYLDEEMSYAARRRFGREQEASLQGSAGVVVLDRIPPRSGAAEAAPSPAPQAGAGVAAATVLAPNLEKSVRDGTPTIRPNIGTATLQPASYEGDWIAEITFHVGGDSFTYEEAFEVENGRFKAYLDMRDFRLGSYSERNWILEGSVGPDGRLQKSNLYYARANGIVFALDGTLEQATGRTRQLTWTTTMKGHRAK